MRPPASDEFLLAFLALTARFHPILVAFHSSASPDRVSSPQLASRFYASAAAARIGEASTICTLERTQTLLMLGLYEWGAQHGSKAWIYVGLAIRMAQSLGLQYESDLDDEPLSLSLALEPEMYAILGPDRRLSQRSATEEDDFVQREIRRRTFWSCFIMDRYLSSGKYRPQAIDVKDIRIQLPSSGRSFLFAEKVRTLRLGEEQNIVIGRAELQRLRRESVSNGIIHPAIGDRALSQTQTNGDQTGETEDQGKLQAGIEEGLISRYVKMLEIYGNIVRWSCSGGSRSVTSSHLFEMLLMITDESNPRHGIREVIGTSSTNP